MRALRVFQLGDPVDVLQVASVPSPEPGPSQVRIRVAAAALNFADDLVCRGRYQVKQFLGEGGKKKVYLATTPCWTGTLPLP